MKNAYERALERFGADEPDHVLDEDQRRQIAEIQQLYKSREAEARLKADSQLKAAANDPESTARIRHELADSLDRLQKNCERDKDRVRNAGS